MRRLVSLRALSTGIVLSILVDLWLHYAELVLGSARGHTALANTSIPVGAFCAFLFVVSINQFLRRYSLPSFTRGELITIYAMLTTSTVISSSGGMHFLIPTLVAGFWFASPENKWEKLFHPYVPSWLVPRSRSAIENFYLGDSPVPIKAWLKPMLLWLSLLFALVFATLCINLIFRKQWIERERLTFPTVFLPVEMTKEGFFQNRLIWIGFAIPFILDALNTLSFNFPTIPRIDVRPRDISPYFTTPPFNAIGYTPISFYPFVIGIGYLISLEVLFSSWFFFFLTRVQRILGSAWGIGQQGGPIAEFPFLGHQGAGAFLGIAFVALWLGRRHLKEVLLTAIGKARADEGEPFPYKFSFWGFILSLAFIIGFCVVAGMRLIVAIPLVLIALAYMMSATRMRAEAGNAWLFGPDVDPNTLMTSTIGTKIYLPQDLTIMSYMRVFTSYDLRCLSMPHQLDALKMAELTDTSAKSIVINILIAIAFGLFLSFYIALAIWYRFGGGAKCDAWRSITIPQNTFNSLASWLQTPLPTNWYAISFLIGGLIFTIFLYFMKLNFIWWPFNPIGYAIANTFTMTWLWMPFFLAWLLKLFIIKYGGMKLYRQAMPFFLGLIMGDFVGGGLTTLMGCFVKMNVYPINW